MRPKGFLTISGFADEKGRHISTQQAVDNGLYVPDRSVVKPRGWGIGKHEIPLGPNLFTDVGRQSLAYAFGQRNPMSNFTCAKFGVGTGTTAPQTTDVALESPITFYDSNGDSVADSSLKPVTSNAFPYPFIIDINITLGYNEANGYLITEWGLFSNSGLLLARRVNVGYNKNSSLNPSFVWRLRF